MVVCFQAPWVVILKQICMMLAADLVTQKPRLYDVKSL